jgi:hypothetical protein
MVLSHIAQERRIMQQTSRYTNPTPEIRGSPSTRPEENPSKKVSLTVAPMRHPANAANIINASLASNLNSNVNLFLLRLRSDQ